MHGRGFKKHVLNTALTKKLFLLHTSSCDHSNLIFFDEDYTSDYRSTNTTTYSHSILGFYRKGNALMLDIHTDHI